MTRRGWIVFALLALVPGFVVTAWAWHEKEHAAVTAMSARLLADAGMPEWFLKGVAQESARASIDPDTFKIRSLRQLASAEAPEHFLDFEPLAALVAAGKPLPQDRFEYYKYCYDNKLDPKKLGTLPYALTEWQQRLTVAMAEHRKWPEDAAIQQKCLIYAGIMAHYAADLCMPLHTTIHYDGRVANHNAPTPRTGIHARMDGLFRNFDYEPAKVLDGASAEVFADTWTGMWAEFERSHQLVDRVYELEDRLPKKGGGRVTDPEVTAFGVERMRASVTFTASLYRTAWAKSAELKLPDWLDHEAGELPH